MRIVKAILKTAGAVTMIAAAGWLLAIVAAVGIVAIASITVWIFGSDERTRRLVEVIKAWSERVRSRSQ